MKYLRLIVFWPIVGNDLILIRWCYNECSYEARPCIKTLVTPGHHFFSYRVVVAIFLGAKSSLNWIFWHINHMTLIYYSSLGIDSTEQDNFSIIYWRGNTIRSCLKCFTAHLCQFPVIASINVVNLRIFQCLSSIESLEVVEKSAFRIAATERVNEIS